MLMESMKVLLYFVYEFFYNDLVLLLTVFMMQSALRAVVSSNFFVKALVIIKKENRILCFQAAYYSVIGTIYAILLILALFAFEAGQDGSINCNKKIFSYHWFILDSVDLIQSALICASAVFIVRHLKRTMQKKDPGAGGGSVDDLMRINNQTMSIISEARTATALSIVSQD
jgi:hypothetical protein